MTDTLKGRKNKWPETWSKEGSRRMCNNKIVVARTLVSGNNFGLVGAHDKRSVDYIGT